MGGRGESEGLMMGRVGLKDWAKGSNVAVRSMLQRHCRVTRRGFIWITIEKAIDSLRDLILSGVIWQQVG